MDKETQWLRLVAERHDEWVKMVHSFGEYTYAEDIVQEMYIALLKYTNSDKIIENGVVSRGYVFFTIRSLYYQFYNKTKKISKVSLDDEVLRHQIVYSDNVEENEAFHKICLMVDDISDSWGWYDRKLWKLYSQTDMSMRKLAKETNISWVSIYNSLKHLKQELKDKLSEDYKDYKNKDYERI